MLDQSGAKPYAWLLCLLYVVYIMNHLAIASLNGRTPLEALTGMMPDISPLLCGFTFWEPVYYSIDNHSFPSESQEKLGHFVGFAENIGHLLTFKVLTDDTQKVIYRSKIRSALKPDSKNRRLDPFVGEEEHKEHPLKTIRDRHDVLQETKGLDPKMVQLPTIDASDLIGRTFLMPPQDDGTRFRAKILEAIDENERNAEKDPAKIRYRISVNDEEHEDLVTYNQVLNHIESDDTDHGVWKFKAIIGHQGPLRENHPDYKGSSYNVLVAWETGEQTYEPLDLIAKDDPVTCAIYAKDKALLDKPGWKHFKSIAK